MSGFLLDTNVLSELIKPKPQPQVVSWMDSADEDLLYISVLTIGEIRRGIDSHPDPLRRARLEAWLSGQLMVRFSGHVLPISIEIAERWGRIRALAKRPLPNIDSLIAATAHHHNLTIVSRNAKDFGITGVSVFNPWDG